MQTSAEATAELLDQPDLCLADTHRALGDLERANRLLFGLPPVLRTVLPRLRAGSPRQMVVDLGTGSGQVAERLRKAAERSGRRVSVIGVDRKLSHLLYGRQRGAVRLPVAACVTALPFRDRSLDWSLSTLLLHHFDHDSGRRFLAEMARVARHGAIVVDLRRALLARLLVRLLLPLLGIGHVATHDGRVSTDSAWTLPEVRRQCDGLSITELRRRFPFRFSLVARRD